MTLKATGKLTVNIGGDLGAITLLSNVKLHFRHKLVIIFTLLSA